MTLNCLLVHFPNPFFVLITYDLFYKGNQGALTMKINMCPPPIPCKPPVRTELPSDEQY